MPYPACLATQWMPTAALGAESLRERAASSSLPPLYFLHVWWARRPLVLSRAAILASLLPAWQKNQNIITLHGGGAGLQDEGLHVNSQEVLEQLFGTEERYQQWFLEALGIFGDPAAKRRLIDAEKKKPRQKQERIGYGYPRAFTHVPTQDDLERLVQLTGKTAPTVLDIFGGGGSIPFEASRFGCRSKAIELNPVATAVLQGTIALPFKKGPGFLDVIREYGNRWLSRIEPRIYKAYRYVSNELKPSYIWAHTVPCPVTGHPTPLLPNHWLARQGKQQVALRLDPDPTTGNIQIIILQQATQTEGERQTYKRGVATSVFTGDTFDGNYIAKEAQAGRMGYMLLAIAYRPAGGRGTQFRKPVPEDLEAIVRAEQIVEEQWDTWDAQGLIPSETVPEGQKTKEPQRYGMTRWCDMFIPRQLLTMVVALDELHQVLLEAEKELEADVVKALNLYLAFALDKVVNYNSRMVSWHAPRMVMRSVFDQHNFAFKWSFAEMEGVDACRWGLNQVVDCYQDIAKLASGNADPHLLGHSGIALHPGEPTMASATALPYASSSVDVIVTDPPYHDNVMYAELSDYFYVWLKRSLKPHWPELCQQYLTDKDNEAVANRSRFEDMATHAGRGKKLPGTFSAQDLAADHYESLMAGAFRESFRVLKPEGALTVMFTHKKTEAWNSLATALLDAGFQITSSWPVSTESPHSLHQSGKNAATATILLTCLKRQSQESAFWNEIQGKVRQAARQAAIDHHAKAGLTGVDITLASFGSALAALSARWPVYTGELDDNGQRIQVTPEQALDLARQEVSRTKLEQLLAQGRGAEFDPPTNWWLLAWLDFGARKFPAGEALKLSHATHLELEADLRRGHRLVDTRGGNAAILTPEQRFESRMLPLLPDILPSTWIDCLHSLMVLWEQDGLLAAREWLRHTGLLADMRWQALIRAAVHAVPRYTDRHGNLDIPEAKTLESIRAGLYPDDIEAPPLEKSYEQPGLGL